MNETRDWSRSATGPAGKDAGSPLPANSDDPVVRALEEYFAAMLVGQRLERAEFLDRHPLFPPHLATCLDGLEFVQTVAQHLASAPQSPQSAAQAGGHVLGDYRILREIGRGGMGVVYEAEQVSLARRVAVKILPFASGLDQRRLERFKNEARAVAHLHHTHIVPIFSNGQEGGVHYYAMQYIEGQNLASVIREIRGKLGLRAQRARALSGLPTKLVDLEAEGEGSAAKLGADVTPVEGTSAVRAWRKSLKAQPDADITPREGAASETLTQPTATLLHDSITSAAYFRNVARLGVHVAEALHHAHGQDVIHRDIKPANILLDIHGSPWVADFGLAQFHSELGLTLTGTLLGTLRYMSPEQALAKLERVDRRTDVYSLGVTLYELLTLEPAIPGKERHEVLHKIAFEEPRPPRRLNRSLPPELELIVLKAIAKIPDDRYATAQELADDLQRFLDDRSIKAKRPPLYRRVLKWTRRHRRVIAITSSLVLMSCLAVMLAIALIWYESSTRYERLVKQARDLNKDKPPGYRDEAWGKLASALQAESSADHIDELRHLAAAGLGDCTGVKPTILKDWPEEISAVALHPEGGQLAVGLLDGSVWFHDRNGQSQLVRDQTHTAAVQGLAFSADGARLASVGDDGSIHLCSRNPIGGWTRMRTLRTEALTAKKLNCRGVKLSHNGTILAIAAPGGTSVTLWRFEGDQTPRRLPLAPGQTLTCLELGQDGGLLAAGVHAADGAHGALLWDLHQIDKPARGISSMGLVRGLAMNADSTLLVCAFESGGYTAVDLPEFAEPRGKFFTQETYGVVAFGREDRLLTATSSNTEAILWHVVKDPGVKQLTRPFAGLRLRDPATQTEPETVVIFSGDGKTVATVTPRAIAIRSLDCVPECVSLAGHSRGITDMAFAPDGKVLATASLHDGTLRLWNPGTGERLRLLSSPAQTLAFHPRAKALLSADDRGRLTSWNTDTWKGTPLEEGTPKPVQVIRFSPSGNHLAAAGKNGVWLWRVRGGDSTPLTLERESVVSDQPARGIAFDAAGTLLAWASDDGIQRWDLNEARALGTLPLRQGGEKGLFGFTPDGQQLVLVGASGVGEIWDVARREKVHSLGQRNQFMADGESDGLSPDGRWFAARATPRTLNIWDLRSRQLLLPLPDPDNRLGCLAWSPDGQVLAVGSSYDGALRVWNLALIREKLGTIGLGWE